MSKAFEQFLSKSRHVVGWFGRNIGKTKFYEEHMAFITEEDGDPDKLSLIDIKAAIASQGIPIGELFSKQDITANRDVIELVHTAEVKAKSILEKEIIILKKSKESLQEFKDKADVIDLVKNSPDLTDKDPATVSYIETRMRSGRGVDLSGGLSEAERQEKVNEAIKEEIELITTQGITFKIPGKNSDGSSEGDDFKDDPTNSQDRDMQNPENNSLIPG